MEECHGEIRNGDFETFSELPNCFGQISRACNWYTAKVINIHNNVNSVMVHPGTFDYWHTNFSPLSSECLNFSIPNGYYANESVRVSGTNAYAGFFSLLRYTSSDAFTNGLQDNYREYMQQELDEPLLPGKTYTLSFWITLGELSNVTTDIHIGFTSSLPKINYLYSSTYSMNTTDYHLNWPVTSQEGHLITISPGAVFTGWTPISITFTYTGQYPAYYMTVGNWMWDGLACNETSIPGGPAYPMFEEFYNNFYACYYMIDDINVVYENDPCCDGDFLTIDGRGGQYQYISNYSISPGQKLLLEGFVIIDQNYTFTNNEIRMGKDARIILQPGNTVTFDNSVLKACDVMWDGIYAQHSASTVTFINGSEMWDAINGIVSTNGAPVDIEPGSWFQNNYHTVKLGSYTGNYPVTIEGSTFTSNSLLPPYWAKHSLDHVNMTTSGTVTINPDNRNEFRNSSFGIVGTNTHINIGNNYFSDIQNYGNTVSKSIASYNTIGGTVLRNIHIGDLGKGGNDFENSAYGVYMQGAVDANISHNNFYFMNNTGIQAENVYRSWGGATPVITISENIFNTAGIGVDIYNLLGARVLIEKNDLSNIIAFNNTYGFRLRNPSTTKFYTRCSENLGAYQVQILENNLVNYGKSIRNEFIWCLLIDHNNIVINTGTGGQFQGISTMNCYQSRTIHNTVTGEVSDWRMIGIRQGNSLGAITRCNTINTCGPAIMFDGAVTNYSFVHNNSMYNSETGIYLNNSEIGPQTPGQEAQINRWYGTFTNHFYSYNSWGHFSPFYFRSGIPPAAEWPNPLYSNRNSTFYTTIPNPPTTGQYTPVWSTCYPNYEKDKTTELILDSIMVYNMALNIIEETTTPPTYEVEATDLRNRAAYSIILDNGWYLTNSHMNDFISNYSGTNTEILYKAYKHLENGDFTMCLQELDSITNASATDSALIAGIRMYITSANVGEGIRNINDLPQVADLYPLIDLASDCYYRYNEATLTARVLMERMLGIEFENDCEGYYVPHSQQTTAPAPLLKAYPNPAGQQVIIDLLFVEDEVYTLTLTDAYGRQVYTTLIYAGQNMLELPSLAGGFYFYSVTLQNEVIGNGKLVIRK